MSKSDTAEAETTIEEILSAATEITQEKGEDRQAYLTRLHDAATELDESGWDDLGEPAQLWVNKATKAEQANKEIPEFPDVEPTDDDEEEEVEEEAAEEEADTESDSEESNEEDDVTDTDTETEKPPKKKPAPKAAKPAAKKAAAPKAAAKEKPAKKAVKADGGSKATSARRLLKQFVVKKPSITVDDLMERAKKAGHKLSDIYISSLRSDTRDTLKVAKECGVVLEDLDL
jgi:hypothetical protein